jgi:2-polyprenyl-3-methyl-5-hydroxy-6-metoxy-1,4-benzoquinol methylase
MCILSDEQKRRRVTVMPDALFAEPKLAEIYDLLDSPDRPDLAPYLAIADEFSAHSVIDLGCGTGTLACRFAELRFEVSVDGRWEAPLV